MGEFTYWTTGGLPKTPTKKYGGFNFWLREVVFVDFAPDQIILPNPIGMSMGVGLPTVTQGSLTFTPGAASVAFSSLITGIITVKNLDVTLRWRYAKRGNVEEFDLVQGTEDPSKAPAFNGYEIQVFSKEHEADAYVYRRTVIVMDEEFTYTQAMNQADTPEGDYFRFLRFIIAVRETTSFRSVTREKEVVVV